MEAYRVVRCGGSLIFWTIGSQMTVRLLALHAGSALLHRNIFWYSYMLEAE
jgi:hypothetical protein